MLSDLLLLEDFYGRQSAALYIEDVLERYGTNHVYRAINQGYLVTRRICIGPDCGRDMCWLSEAGKQVSKVVRD